MKLLFLSLLLLFPNPLSHIALIYYVSFLLIYALILDTIKLCQRV